MAKLSPYIVTRKVLNVRNKPSIEDESLIGELPEGATVYLHPEEISDIIPRQATTGIWLRDPYNRYVAKEGVSLLDWPAIKLKLIEAVKNFWNYSTGDTVVIGLFDTGVMNNHLGISPKIKRFHCFKDGVAHVPHEISLPIGELTDNHGTRMAGLLSGISGGEMVGFAPGLEIHDYRIFQTNGRATRENFREALKLALAAEQLSVLNLSIAFYPGQLVPIRPELDELIKACIQKGKIVVAATGNTSCADPQSPAILYPGCIEEVITIGAIVKGIPVNYKDCQSSLENLKTPDCFIEMDDWQFCNRDHNNNGIIEQDARINSSEATAVFSSLVALKKKLAPSLNQAMVKAQVKKCSSLIQTWKGMKIHKLNIPDFLNE